MIRIGLFGKPSNVQQLIDILLESPYCILSGIFFQDADQYLPENQIDQPAIIFNDEDDLIAGSDAIIFYDFNQKDSLTLKKALKASRHIFLDPADILSPEILTEIHKLGEEAGVLYYLKHKPLNGDFQKKLEQNFGTPEFLDIYRYVPSENEENSDTIQRIIRQEMIFIFSLNNHMLKRHHLKTVPYCSWNPYIINLRFEFANSSAANLTVNFFTQTNARFTELFYNENILRINSKNSEIEFINRNSGTFKITRNRHNLKNENKLSEEIKRFLTLLNEKQYPADLDKSGLLVHHNVWEIIHKFTEVKISQE